MSYPDRCLESMKLLDGFTEVCMYPSKVVQLYDARLLSAARKLEIGKMLGEEEIVGIINCLKKIRCR